MADASRIDYVANLIKDQIEAGNQPRAVVCSAMGKTTNNLLSAGEFALGTFIVGYMFGYALGMKNEESYLSSASQRFIHSLFK